VKAEAIMQRVTTDILRLRRFSSDTTFAVFGDLRAGAIDLAHPLPPGPQGLWPAAAPRAGHLLDAHLLTRHLDSVCPDGHLNTLHLRGEHLYPARPVRFASPGYVFGRFRHAVRMYDGAGNAAGEVPLADITVNSNPTPPHDGRVESYDPQADRITMAFRPGRFRPLPGN
jgi:hypothetical protein